MATVSGPPSWATRNKPIQPRLSKILSDAADACGITAVRISSGGQDPKGKGTRRTGSTRHDADGTGHGGAADLELLVGARVLNFQQPNDRPLVARFVTECSRRGATGIGAGVDYMGPTKLHVGFGAKSTWGGPNARSADAPQWLRDAVAAASGPAGQRVLELNMTGEDVKALQKALNKALGLALTDDGDFGERTEAAVRDFQTKRGLTADGKVGPATRGALGL